MSDILNIQKSHIWIPALLKSHKCIPGAQFFIFKWGVFPIITAFIYPCLVITVKWPKITFRGSKMVPKVTNCFLFGEEGYLVYQFLTLVESWMGNLSILSCLLETWYESTIYIVNPPVSTGCMYIQESRGSFWKVNDLVYCYVSTSSPLSSHSTIALSCE